MDYKVFKIIKIICLGGLAMILLGTLVQFLWNWLIPDLVGGNRIDLGQSLGLLLLSRILFGGWGRGHQCYYPKPHHWKARFEDKMSCMTPEEREEYRKNFWKKCGSECEDE